MHRAYGLAWELTGQRTFHQGNHQSCSACLPQAMLLKNAVSRLSTVRAWASFSSHSDWLNLVPLSPSADELDHGRPKAALAELQKYLKKAPQRNGTPLVEALRCLSLQRLGQIDEAYETFLKLASEGGQFAADKGTLTSTPAPATKLKVIKGKNGKVIKKPAPAAAKSEAAAPAKEPEAPPLPSASTSKQPAERKWKDLPENILFTLGHALKPMGKCKWTTSCYQLFE